MDEQQYSWVNARAACSPFEVFKCLLMGAETDVKERNATLAGGSRFTFKIGPCDEESFLVIRQVGKGAASVEFVHTAVGIQVRDDARATILEGILTLNDEGNCRLKVGDKELTFWQFRRRALEALFFNVND